MLLQKEAGVIENSYYEASVARPPPLAPLQGRVRADVCVVGAGLAGLSAALELAQRGYSVVVLEAQRIGWGASGRNGGQVLAGFGADGELAIERQLPRELARHTWAMSVEAVELVRRRIARYRIACDFTDGALSLAVNARKMRVLDAWAHHVTQQYGHVLEWIAPQDMAQWIGSARFHAGVADMHCGHMHPLKYCLGLAQAAQAAGVRLFENSPVRQLVRTGAPEAHTAQGTVQASFIVLAGNVYLAEYGKLAPELDACIMPVGTYMIGTAPLAPAHAQALLPRRSAVSDTNFVLDYFRLSSDNRLLFGAGDSYSASTPRNLVERIRKRMLAVFPELSGVAIDYAWGGFVDITMNRTPQLGCMHQNIYYMQGFSGHGLAFTGMAGVLVAEAIDGQARRLDVFSRLKHHRFPGGALMRTPALVLGMLYLQLRDLL